ncbi:type 1 fimbrial protein, partial [Proteus mirabilis]
TDVRSRIVNKFGDNNLTFKALSKVVYPSKDVVEGTFSAISNFRITYE